MDTVCLLVGREWLASKSATRLVSPVMCPLISDRRTTPADESVSASGVDRYAFIVVLSAAANVMSLVFTFFVILGSAVACTLCADFRLDVCCSF